MNSPPREIRRVRHEVKQRRMPGYCTSTLRFMTRGPPPTGRRLEELPEGSRAVAIAEVEDASEEQDFPSKAQLSVRWVYRRGGGARQHRRLMRRRMPTI
jgi:hypothetical protein